MATYRVTDPQTGRKLRLTGDSPPTEAELNQIFGAGQTETTEPTPQRRSVGGFLTNIAGSAYKNAKDIVGAITHPVQTVKGLGNVAMGAGQLLVPGEQGKEDYARNVGDFYKDRYGGVENIKNTVYEDPVGVALDVSTIAGLGSGAAKGLSKVATLGGASNLADDALRASGQLGKIERATNVLAPRQALNAFRGGAVDDLSAVSSVGKSIENAGSEASLRGYGKPQTIAGFEEGTKTKRGFGQGATADLIDEFNVERSPEGVQKFQEDIDNIQTQYDDVVVNSGVIVPLEDLLSSGVKRIQELMSENTEVSKPKAKRVETELANFLDNVDSEGIDVKQLTERRKIYDDYTGRFKLDEATKGPYQELRDLFQDVIYRNTKHIGPAEELGKKLNKMIEFKKRILTGASRKGTTTKLMSGVRDAVPPAVAHVAFNNPFVTAGVWGAEKILNNPKVSAGLSSGQRSLGRKIQEVGNLPGVSSIKGNDIMRFGKTGTRLNPFKSERKVEFKF